MPKTIPFGIDIESGGPSLDEIDEDLGQCQHLLQKILGRRVQVLLDRACASIGYYH